MKRPSELPGLSLTLRPCDERLKSEDLLCVELFTSLARPPNFALYSDSVVLRRYCAGEVICSEADPGGTVFYILKSEDALALIQRKLDAAQDQRSSSAGGQSLQQLAVQIQQLTDSVAQCSQRVASLSDSSGDDSSGRIAATASIQLDAGGKQNRPAILGRIGKRLFGSTNSEPSPLLANDGPCDIDTQRVEAFYYEGEMFGEMSCSALAPRTATVVAKDDCVMLEIRRDLFQQIQADSGYRQQVDSVYRQRTLEHHLRRLEMLADANPQDLDWISQRVEFSLLEPGAVLADENSEIDSVYIIRNGRVDALNDLGLILTAADVSDWRALCQELSSVK